MSAINVLPVRTRRQKRAFLTFPWKVYKHDPLWVPPLISERRKTIDPRRGLFFKNGYARLFVAWRKGKPVGTIACAEDRNNTAARGYGECMIGFFECVDDYAVAEALFDRATAWAREHKLVGLYGTYNLDREESRGVLIEGRDQPPASYCGHNPPYYQGFFERYGFQKDGEDGLAYIIRVDLSTPEVQHMMKLAEKIRQRKNITVRGGNLRDVDGEIDRVLELQNRGLAHFPGFTPYTRDSIEAMIRPVLDILDPELVLFAEVDGKTVGWFPGVPNMNEVLIHVNGLRRPWDYLRLLRYARLKPKTLAVKSVAVLPEYWDTGVGVLLFDEMARRAAAKGYQWVDLSVTGEDNTDTFPLARRMGAKIYKRYRFYRKQLSAGKG
ncbi:MAG: GNAT family N-acetyltransferase [Chloroflexi bacterium]|nr:GNAT family N-acetyltransferase [Chloroflexota bacterium]